MGVLEQPRPTRVALAVLVLLGLVGGGAAYLVRPGDRGSGAASVPLRPRAVPGESDRIVVEVLNASGQTGLARITTGRLRDGGIDVVYFGSDTTSALDTTEILVRRGEARAGEAVRDLLGGGHVRPAPDPARLVDVSVRVGRDLALRFRDP